MTVWNEDLVIKNKFSRPGMELLAHRGLVIHWTANPGASDTGHQAFFDGLDGGGSRYAGAHIFVDKDSAVLIIPLDEVAYHANEKACKIAKLKGSVKRADGSTYFGDANVTTIGLEMCVEKDGTIHPDTIKRSMEISALLCKQFNWNPLEDIYRHYDVTGKNCPRPWVENGSLFTKFKNDVKAKLTVAPAPAKAVTKPKSHVVESGETFYSIAKKYGISVADLQKFNPRVKPTDMKVGDVIYLYAVPVKAAPTPTQPTPAPKPTQPTSYFLPMGTLRKGDKGVAVKEYQTALNKLKFNCGTPDGIFGNGTLDAVKRFQSVYANPADGVIGTNTRGAMIRELDRRKITRW
jgi:N-acetylmuramoyl-L-alanine amidase